MVYSYNSPGYVLYKWTTWILEVDISDTRHEIAKSVRIKHTHTCGCIWYAVTGCYRMGENGNFYWSSAIQSDHWILGSETKILGL